LKFILSDVRGVREKVQKISLDNWEIKKLGLETIKYLCGRGTVW
jgi:hypothetical protein